MAINVQALRQTCGSKWWLPQLGFNRVWSLDYKKGTGSRLSSPCTYLLSSWSKGDSNPNDIYLTHNDYNFLNSLWTCGGLLDILYKIGFSKHKIVFKLYVFNLHILVTFNFCHTKMILTNNSLHKYKLVGHELGMVNEPRSLDFLQWIWI